MFYGFSTGTIRRNAEKSRRICGENAEETLVSHGEVSEKSYLFFKFKSHDDYRFASTNIVIFHFQN